MTTRVLWVDVALDPELLLQLDRGVAIDGLPLGDLDESNSCMLIQTEHSLYLFLGSTPADPRGLLLGGVFGESPTDAFLVGAISTSNVETESPTSLTAGSRAVFHVLSDNSFKRVVTSTIVRLVHTHVASRDSLATVH